MNTSIDEAGHVTLVTELEQKFFAIVFTTICVFGVVGNVLVQVVIARSRKMLSSKMNVVILNLTVADLGTLLLGVPEIIIALQGSGWVLAGFLCPTLRFLEQAFYYLSIAMQIIVCVQRYGQAPAESILPYQETEMLFCRNKNGRVTWMF